MTKLFHAMLTISQKNNDENISTNMILINGYQCYRRVDPIQKMLKGDGHFPILVVHLLVFSLKGKNYWL